MAWKEGESGGFAVRNEACWRGVLVTRIACWRRRSAGFIHPCQLSHSALTPAFYSSIKYLVHSIYLLSSLETASQHCLRRSS